LKIFDEIRYVKITVRIEAKMPIVCEALIKLNPIDLINESSITQRKHV
jgi:hypothetical protein